jgi:hypothetical protein
LGEAKLIAKSLDHLKRPPEPTVRLPDDLEDLAPRGGGGADRELAVGGPCSHSGTKEQQER